MNKISGKNYDCDSPLDCIWGFQCALDENLAFPFKAKVVGEEIDIVGVDVKNDILIAICQRKNKKYSVDILNVEFDPRSVKGSEWIEAFKVWQNGY